MHPKEEGRREGERTEKKENRPETKGKWKKEQWGKRKGLTREFSFKEQGRLKVAVQDYPLDTVGTSLRGAPNSEHLCASIAGQTLTMLR